MRFSSRHREGLSGRKASAPKVKDEGHSLAAMEQGSEAEKPALLVPVC